MLDVGYGSGATTWLFHHRLGVKETYGLDANPKKVSFIKGIKADLNNEFPFMAEQFNFILCSQTIEHLHSTRFFLEECYRVLKPDGKILIMTENLASWINIFALLMGWTPFSLTNTDGWNIGNPIMKRDETKEPDYLFQEMNYRNSGMVGHVRVMTYDGLKDIMTRVGFKTKIYSTGFWGFKKHGHFLVALGEK